MAKAQQAYVPALASDAGNSNAVSARSSFNQELSTIMRISLVAILFLALASQPALAGIPNTVAIAVDTSSLRPKVAAEVQDGIATRIVSGLSEVMSALAGTDITLTPVSDHITQEGILACEGDVCLQDLARIAKVDLVIRVRVNPKQPSKKASKRSKQDFAISMVVARPAPDRDAWSETTDCQACAASEVKHAASLLASAIAEHIKVKATTPEPTREPVPTPAPVVVDAPAPPAGMAVHPTTTAPSPAWSVPRAASVAALAGGVLLLGSGLYLIHINGQGACDLSGSQELCARRYKTQNLGIGLLAGGGVAALGGLAGLLWFSPSTKSTPVALTITGSSIAIAGEF
jgi:hypothetical protein